MELDLVGTEVPVGPFSADVVLADANSGRRVVVENFLEATNHDHLGKLITYASGLDSSYAVLVAKEFRPEHRSALKWLNDISKPDNRFFGIEVHAVRIGTSPPAVRLDVVVKPEEWQRQVRQTAAGQLTDTQALYLEWWSEFLPALHETYPGWSNATKASSRNWLSLPAGRRRTHFSVNFSWPTGGSYRLRVEFYMHDGDKWCPVLEASRGQLDVALGPGLSWEPLEDSKASRIAVYLEEADPEDRSAWRRYRQWALEMLGRFREVLQPILAAATI